MGRRADRRGGMAAGARAGAGAHTAGVRAHAAVRAGADDVEDADEIQVGGRAQGAAGGGAAPGAGERTFGQRDRRGGGVGFEQGDELGQQGQDEGVGCRQRSGRLGAELDLGAQFGQEAEERLSRGDGVGC